ncbi:MAG: hypothetical protein ABIK65_00850 [Candidatus Eisenbacteria bacterium]
MTTPFGRLLCAALLGALLLAPRTVAAGGAMSLRFDRIPVAELLPLIADHYGLDLIVAGEPPGTVSVDLKDSALGEVLGEILVGTGYTYMLTERTIRIMPGTTVVGRTFHLDHLNALTLADDAASILTEAELTPNLTANALTVVGTAVDVRNLEDMIQETDVEPRQVDIRSRMIEVNVGELQTLGVDWFLQWSDDIQSADARGNVNDPSFPNLRLGFSRLTTWQADAVLEAILSNTDSRVISSPRIAAANNETSKILVGERLPYTRLTVETASGGVQEEVDFVDVGVQLEVTPLISSDSMVTMIVNAEISEVLDQEVQGIPRIGTREAHTRVVARSGETLVIGGLRKNQEIESVSGIPYVSRIPFLGRLFRYESVRHAQTEILIFLTPVIMGSNSTPIDFTGRLVREEETRLLPGQSP